MKRGRGNSTLWTEISALQRTRIRSDESSSTPTIAEHGEATLEALLLVCTTGFAKFSDLQLLSLKSCNASREAGVPWSLTLAEETPASIWDWVKARPDPSETVGASNKGRVARPETIRILR